MPQTDKTHYVCIQTVMIHHFFSTSGYHDALVSYFHSLLVSRALGIPCRVITNYVSAHDTNNNLVIERYINENGDLVQSREMIWYVFFKYY